MTVPGTVGLALSDRYRVERELGRGGMATVYLAQDVRHDRQVAIKLLHEDLGATLGPERFLAEIKTTAKLQHPHILPLLDSGTVGGLLYYVMPYVEGETLRSRLTRETQLPIEDAVRIAREVADALGFAHGHGIVHRDIKPENILLQGGHALVADFGIALAVQQAGGTRLTQTGLSLGTPQYMSPEQAMGDRTVDHRSDIYALGAVTYEMLTGDPPFTGSSVQAIVARVLSERPTPPTMIRDTVPPNVEAAVLKALAKLPADRWAGASEFATVLGSPITTAPPVPLTRRQPWSRLAIQMAPWLVAVAAVLVAAISGREPRAVEPTRLSLPLDAGSLDPRSATWRVAISPDGRRVAYISGSRIFVRDIADRRFREMSETEGSVSVSFAGDGDSVALWQTGSGNVAGLRKVAIEGGRSPILKMDMAGAGFSQSQDRLLFTRTDGSLVALAANGDAQVIAVPDSAAGESQLWGLGFLPDARILTVATTNAFQPLRLDATNLNGSRMRIVEGPVAFAAYAAGMLLTVLSNGEMSVASFNASSLERGPAVIIDTVASTILALPVVAADTVGTVVYAAGSPRNELVIVDRNGDTTILERSRQIHRPRVSPDGKRLLVDVTERGDRDVWRLDLGDPSLDRITRNGSGHDPTWMPDGQDFLYLTLFKGSSGVGTLRHRSRGSPADTIGWRPDWQVQIHDVTPDGRTGIAVTGSSTNQTFDLAEVMLDGSRQLRLMDSTVFSETHPALSPGGRWLAYTSDESGRSEVYVRPYGRPGARVKVSVTGASEPVWRRDGNALYYRPLDSRNPKLTEVRLATGAELRVLDRVELFSLAEYAAGAPHANYDILPDGRFVMVRQTAITSLAVIQNWPLLARRLLGEAGRR